MALNIPKREDIKKSNLVIPKRGEIKKETKPSDIRRFDLGEQFGGGSFLVTDDPNELIKSKRSQDALPSVGTAERDHIISVALGGTSDIKNLQYLATTKDGRQEGKVSVEQKAINDYISGKITLQQARLAIAQKQQQIKGLAPTEKEKTWQGQIGNVIKDFFSSLKIEGNQSKLAKIASEVSGKEITAKNYRKEFDKLPKEQQDLIFAKFNEQGAEAVAKIATAPIKYTAGSLASLATSYALERADSDKKFTPKTDAEKLLINDVDIQRLTKQEDLYGLIARGAGVPVALLVGAIIESPFIAGTGAGKLVKESIEREIKKISTEQLAKIGFDEIIKLSNGVIRAEQKAGKLTSQQAEQAIKEISNIKVVENIEQPKTNIIQDPLIQEAKKYKSAEEFVNIDKGALTEPGIAKDPKRMQEVLKTKENAQQIKKDFQIQLDESNKRIAEAGVENAATFDIIARQEAADALKTIRQVEADLPTKSQLTDIWNKAQKASELKYEPTIAQPSVPNRIKNETIEKGIKADFQGIEEYDKVSFKEQAKLVGDIIDTDPEMAIKIALGKELPKNGALPESVFIAVKNQAIKNGDTDLLIRLATEEGGVAKESTVLGQRIKMLDEQLEDDAFRNINQVVKARRAKLEKSGISVSKAKSVEVNKIKSEIVKAKPKKDEWLAFIDEIEC